MELNYLLYTNEIKKIEQENTKPKILVHACCAPCSSEVLEELNKHFVVTIYYYNPNIYPYDEYEKRYNEFSKLPNNFEIIKGQFDDNKYYEIINGKENLGEFSLRCYECFYLRMKETCEYAKTHNFDYFTTTLSISPYKKSEWINEIGFKLEEEYNMKYLYSDFKKKEGYKKSIELSKKYNLYRQEYCGCVYSLKEKEQKDLLKK